MPTTQEIAEQIVELLPGFFHLRPKLIVPEHVAHFKEQMESLKKSGVFEDRPMLFRILLLLSHGTAAPTMGELSAELGIPLSSATRIVDSLVNTNILERINDPHDRRVVRIQMSEYGKQFSQTATDYMKHRITTLLENFSPSEQEQLLQLMTKLFKSMEAER
jgi:DNA-binding MarR family transcriptional regulator